MQLLGYILLGAVIWVGLHVVPLFLIGGLDWDDLRSILLHYAYKSFTLEGDVIPGVRPFVGTRLVIRILSPKDDARTALVVKAMAVTEPRAPAHVGRATGAQLTERAPRQMGASNKANHRLRSGSTGSSGSSFALSSSSRALSRSCSLPDGTNGQNVPVLKP